MKLNVYKGFKGALRIPKRIRGRIDYFVKFDESALYELPEDPEYRGYNKLLGIKRRFFAPRDNSYMIAWRPNLKTRLIELVPYYHINGRTWYPNKPLCRVPIGQVFRATIDLDRGIIRIRRDRRDRDEEAIEYIQEIAPDWRKGWRIIHYFGGRYDAPARISIGFRRPDPSAWEQIKSIWRAARALSLAKAA